MRKEIKSLARSTSTSSEETHARTTKNKKRLPDSLEVPPSVASPSLLLDPLPDDPSSPLPPFISSDPRSESRFMSPWVQEGCIEAMESTDNHLLPVDRFCSLVCWWSAECGQFHCADHDKINADTIEAWLSKGVECMACQVRWQNTRHLLYASPDGQFLPWRWSGVA